MNQTLPESKAKRIVTVQIACDRSLTNELTAEIGRSLDQVEDLEAPAVLLLQITGLTEDDDIPDWPGRIDLQAVTKWERLLRRIERSPSITIVILKHRCSALALELLLVADRRIATVDFSVQPAILGRNVWPGMALYRLSRQIGEAVVRKLFLDRSLITAKTGVSLGVIDEIAEDIPNGIDHVEHLLAHAPLDDLAVWRRLVQDSISSSFDEALGLHLAACDRTKRRLSIEQGSS